MQVCFLCAIQSSMFRQPQFQLIHQNLTRIFQKKMIPIPMVIAAKLQVGVRAKKANQKTSEETYFANLDTLNHLLSCVPLITQISIIVRRNEGV